MPWSLEDSLVEFGREGATSTSCVLVGGGILELKYIVSGVVSTKMERICVAVV